MTDVRQSDSEHETRGLTKKIYDATQIARFRMFFAGLIFATISFVGGHEISKTAFLCLKIFEVVAFACLLISGVLLLLRLGGVRYEIGRGRGLSSSLCCGLKCWIWLLDAIFNREKYCWVLFILGMVLLVFNRCVILFYS